MAALKKRKRADDDDDEDDIDYEETDDDEEQGFSAKKPTKKQKEQHVSDFMSILDTLDEPTSKSSEPKQKKKKQKANEPTVVVPIVIPWETILGGLMETKCFASAAWIDAEGTRMSENQLELTIHRFQGCRVKEAIINGPVNFPVGVTITHVHYDVRHGTIQLFVDFGDPNGWELAFPLNAAIPPKAVLRHEEAEIEGDDTAIDT